MQNFTDHGHSVINELASRYGISNEAIVHMLFAVSNGGGQMAQFNCPELGGGGQWMRGGMTMVGDMFNNGLRNTVDNLCCELSNLLANQGPAIFAPVPRREPVSGQQQQQGGGSGQNSLYFPNGGQGNWWIDDLGVASSTGGQNNLRYAVFPQTGRLAVEANGRVTVYDTLDHQIGGVSQQQSGDASMTFTSQFGTVQVSQLPVVSIDGVAQQSSGNAPQEPQPQAQQPMPQEQSSGETGGAGSDFGSSALEEDIFEKIERLAALNSKGILTDDEFSSKKAELLQRL